MKSERGYTMIEMLVYIAVLAVVVNLASFAYFRYDQQMRDVRRNADDIVRAMRAGERWRDDVRNATAPPQAIENGLEIPLRAGEIAYVFADGTVWRRAAGSQAVALKNVKASTMSTDPRGRVSAWRWELELASPKKTVLIRPLFTFTAVCGRSL
jgi:prepilin-type N-terminal cleavage/methylation domain-containing protein